MVFQWSESSQRYRDEQTGRFVPTATINSAVDQVITKAGLRLRDLTARLQDGAITLAEWQNAMVAELKPLYVGAAAVGRGGWAQMSQSDWGWTGQQVRQQYGFLRTFAQDIATGKQPMDGRLLARAAMYAEAARPIQREMMRRVAGQIGRVEERNRLGAADQHCGTCLDCTARGWVPLGSLPAVGARTCRSRCHCTIVTRGLQAA